MNSEMKAILKPRIELARTAYAYTMDILHRALAHEERVSEAEVNDLPHLTEILLNTEFNDADISPSP